MEAVESAKNFNKQQIEQIFKKLYDMDIQLNKKYIIPIPELHIGNHIIKNAKFEFSCISNSHADALAVTQITVGKEILVNRNFLIGEVKSDENSMTTITGDINSHEQTQGSGLATAMMQETNDVVPFILKSIGKPAEQIAIYVVTDRAAGKGTERTGWTSKQMQDLGFSSDRDTVEELIGALGLPVEEDEIEKTFYKVY